MQAFRTRIRLVALGFIVILLGLFSLLLYLGFSTILHGHIDEELVALAEEESYRVDLATDHVEVSSHRQDEGNKEDEEDEREEFDDEDELQQAIRYSAILDPTGRILWSGQSTENRIPVASQVIAQALKGETVFETFHEPGRSPIRRISIPLAIEDHGRFILQTEKSLQFVEETLQWLAWLLCGASAISLLFAWWGSGRLAGEALAPVKALSQTAETISGQTLSTRLTLTSPYAEFQRLAHTFNGMLDRLQQVFEGQRRFVADAAHELKTPLTAMKGNFEVSLQRARSGEEYRETILSNLAEVDRLTAMTKSLLTLAQFAGDRPPLALQTLDLPPLVEDVVSELSVLAHEGGIHLQTEFEPVPPFLGDASQLKQALINLLDNALRHTPSDGTITVRVRFHEGSIRLSVEDSGPGIDSQHLPHLFERFYRIDQARDRHSGGTGLGLAIVKEIVEAHGGTIHAQSQVGYGTTFTITFPTGKNHR
ncbi:MAG TPA: heavy metal sensor histidine kinase [Nitrospirales bacterium]|nr:heavy metal sensor histidine kinase [Nitrospirales bacterium]